MKKIKENQTKSLFYGKFPFKICIEPAHAELLRSPGIHYLKNFETHNLLDYYHKTIDPKDIKKLLKFHSKFEKFKAKNKHVKLRSEWYTTSMYLETRKEFEEVKTLFRPYISEMAAPVNDADIETLGEKRGIILCNKLPHGRFKFRINLSTNFDESQRRQFLTWIEKYGTEAKISSATKGWLEGDYYYLYNPYVYVETEAVLSMCGLFLGSRIKRKYEYVLRKPINTVSKDKNAKSKQNV